MAKTLQDLLVDKEFAARFFKQNTEEDIRKLFHSEGVEITDEELKNLKKLCSEIVNKVEDMGEDELENVAGGFTQDTYKNIYRGSKMIGALAGLGFGINKIRNSKEEISTGKKIANVVVSTLFGAWIGSSAGATASETLYSFSD